MCLTVFFESIVRKGTKYQPFASRSCFIPVLIPLSHFGIVTKIKRTCVMPPAVVASFGQVTNHFYFIMALFYSHSPYRTFSLRHYLGLNKRKIELFHVRIIYENDIFYH